MPTIDTLLEGVISQLNQAVPLTVEPLKIDTKESLELFLELLSLDYTAWGTEKYPGSKPVSVLVKELEDGEAHLSVREYAGVQYILRDISTATLYVTVGLPEPSERNPKFKRKFWLREHHVTDGEKVQRKYRNSMSEKLGPGESFLDAAIRALQQELSIVPDTRYANEHPILSMADFPQVLRPETEQVQYVMGQPEIRRTTRYPGTFTRNALEHFMWDMPLEYYRPGGYHEPGTNHYFEWVEVGANDMTQPPPKRNKLKRTPKP